LSLANVNVSTEWLDDYRGGSRVDVEWQGLGITSDQNEMIK